MTTEEMKIEIDKMSYKELMSKWRFAPVGSPWFAGEIGNYYEKQMTAKRGEVGNDEHVRTSKEIGW